MTIPLSDAATLKRERVMKLANQIHTDSETATDAEMAEDRETLAVDSDEHALWIGPNLDGEPTLAIETPAGWMGIDVSDLATVERIIRGLTRYVNARRDETNTGRMVERIIPTEPYHRIKVTHWGDGSLSVYDEYVSEEVYGRQIWSDSGSVSIEPQHRAAFMAALAREERDDG
jgi:hypothetical protein